MKILIAEDEPVTRLLLEKMISRAGHETIVTDNGLDAANALDAERPPIAILDWNMPQMDGLEVCRQVRARGGDDQPYIIFVTVNQEKEDVVRCLDEGADDFIKKPFNEDELEARIRAGERIPKLRDQVVETESARVLIEAAGAAAHEIRSRNVERLHNQAWISGREPRLCGVYREAKSGIWPTGPGRHPDVLSSDRKRRRPHRIDSPNRIGSLFHEIRRIRTIRRIE